MKMMFRSFSVMIGALSTALAAQATSVFDRTSRQDVGKDAAATKLMSARQQGGPSANLVSPMQQVSTLSPGFGHKPVVQPPRQRNLRWHHATSMFNRMTQSIRGSNLTGLAIT